jgi:hypothetical protein
MPRSKVGRLSSVDRKLLAEVKTCEDSGESLAKYAEHKGVPVYPLYQAKKRAREVGLLPPHRKRTSRSKPSPRRTRPPRFVEAISWSESREGSAVWRVRLPDGAVFESMAPLNIDDALQLVESLRQQS